MEIKRGSLGDKRLQRVVDSLYKKGDRIQKIRDKLIEIGSKMSTTQRLLRFPGFSQRAEALHKAFSALPLDKLKSVHKYKILKRLGKRGKSYPFN